MAQTESMENTEDNDLIAKDLPELIALLSDLKAKVSDVLPNINDLHSRLDSEEMDTKEGISFLEVKFHLLLKYIINVAFVMLLKLDGQSIKGAPVIERLVEIRTILEKIRPIDQRLKYQVDKLVKLAVMGEPSSSSGLNPLSFKPNPENMSLKVDEEEESEDEENQNAAVYVPPKVAAVPYEDDTFDQKKKLEERAKLKSLNKTLLKDLRDEYSEAPEEIKEQYKRNKGRGDEEEEKDKERYEEDNLIRLSYGKKGNSSKRESTLKELTKFGSFGFDSDNEDNDNGGLYKRKAKKTKFSGKIKKKKSKFAFKKKGKFKK